MKLRLRTLSPIHIGTGEELAPLDYVVHNNNFFRITQEQLFNLTEQLLPDNGPEKLSIWVSNLFDRMNDTRDNLQLSRLNDNMNAYRFFEQYGKERELLQMLNEKESIPVLIDERTKNRHRNAPVIPLGQVRGMVKNGQGKPYLPGSSIKGSLRTALFFHFLSKYADKGQIERLIRDQLGKRTRKERFSLPLVHQAFFCGIKDLQKGRLKADDEKMDLLKLVRIPDARLEESEEPIQLGKINIYLVEKKSVKDRSQPAHFEATQQPQASYCENIPPGRILETELDFDIDFLLQVKKFIRDDGIPAGDTIQWIGIEKKVKQLFGLDIQSLTEQNKAEKKSEVFRHLMDCWANFSRRQIASQKEWLDHFKKNDRQGDYTRRIKDGMNQVFSREQNYLIHLGYATGFQGMTAILFFLEDSRMANLYKTVLETFNIGNKPGNRGAYKVNMERFPKSRRMIEDRRSIRPLGWLEWVDETAPAELEEMEISEVHKTEPSKPAVPPPPEPTFFSGTLNYKKILEMDAVVVHSGRPNRVKVYLSPDKMPEMVLNGYASPLEVDTIVIVRTVVSKKGEIVQVSFGRRKLN